jgi:hypothetical protein
LVKRYKRLKIIFRKEEMEISKLNKNTKTNQNNV